jgi:hypothetical protein
MTENQNSTRSKISFPTFSLQQFDDLLWKEQSRLKTSEKRLIAARKSFYEAQRRLEIMIETRKKIVASATTK